MKNKTWPFVTAMLICAFMVSGCTSNAAENIVSTVEKQDCFICGDWSGTVMEIIGKNDSIGLVYLNQPVIYDTEVRVYDDNGNELFNQETIGVRSANFGEGNGCAIITCLPDRGISEITINYKKSDTVNLKHASEILCQDCFDVVMYSVAKNSEYGKKNSFGTTGFYLMDFRMRKLYGLSDPFHRQYMGDYYATFIQTNAANKSDTGTIALTVFYAPERNATVKN